MHLASIHKQVEAFQPHLVIVDPITSFISSGPARSKFHDDAVGRLLEVTSDHGSPHEFESRWGYLEQTV
jgi:hypothetical protein